MNLFQILKHLATPDDYMASIYDISREYLEKHGIRGLMLDLDNTLLTRTETVPTLQCFNWIEDLKSAGIKISIVTNNSHLDRVAQVSNYLDVPAFMRAFKPFPITMKKVLEHVFALPAKDVIVVGDQFFTDIIGGNILGLRTIYVEPSGPEVSNFRKWLIDVDKKVFSGSFFR